MLHPHRAVGSEVESIEHRLHVADTVQVTVDVEVTVTNDARGRFIVRRLFCGGDSSSDLHRAVSVGHHHPVGPRPDERGWSARVFVDRRPDGAGVSQRFACGRRRHLEAALDEDPLHGLGPRADADRGCQSLRVDHLDGEAREHPGRATALHHGIPGAALFGMARGSVEEVVAERGQGQAPHEIERVSLGRVVVCAYGIHILLM